MNVRLRMYEYCYSNFLWIRDIYEICGVSTQCAMKFRDRKSVVPEVCVLGKRWLSSSIRRDLSP